MSAAGTWPERRIAIVDDHSMVTSGLAALLATREILAEEFASLEGFPYKAEFDAVLVDLHLGSSALQGCAAVEALVSAGFSTVVISGGAEQVDICDSIGLGASSYVPKDRAELLVRAIEVAAVRRCLLTGALAGALLADVARRPLGGELASRGLAPSDLRFLECAFHVDGGDAAARELGWEDGEGEAALARIWQTASVRTAAYALALTAREIEIVTLSRRLDSRDEVIAALQIEPTTFQRHLTNIKRKYVEVHPLAAQLSAHEVLQVLGRRAL